MKLHIALILALPLVLASCFRDAGVLITEDRTVGSFTSIDMAGSGRLLITQDTTYQVRIEAGDRLMNYIETEVVNGELRIGERWNRFRDWKPVRIYVSAAYLEGLSLTGSGEITGNGFTATDLDLLLSGSGRIYVEADPQHTTAVISGSGLIDITGDTDYLNVGITGSGHFNGQSFPARIADVSITGSGNATVTVSEELTAAITGSGNINYYGNPPVVDTRITGSGNIRRK